MLYTPAPDDMRAARLALRQLERDPQKNVLYQMGLTRQAGPKRVVELEEIVRPEGLKAVRGGLVVGKDGKTARIVQLEDNSYAIGDAEGKTFTRISVESGDEMVKNVQMVDFPEGASVPGLPPYTRTRRFQVLGPEYGRDSAGSVRGIDLDTGEMDVVPPEKIASREVTHLGTKGKTLGERFLERRAAVTKKKAGIDISEEAINEMDIGEKVKAKAAKASAEEGERIRENLPSLPGKEYDEQMQTAPEPVAEPSVVDQFIADMRETWRKRNAPKGPGYTQPSTMKVESPAPGVATLSFTDPPPGFRPIERPRVVTGTDVDAANDAVRTELGKRPGGNTKKPTEAEYNKAREDALLGSALDAAAGRSRPGAGLEVGEKPPEKPASFANEITSALNDTSPRGFAPSQQQEREIAQRAAYAASLRSSQANSAMSAQERGKKARDEAAARDAAARASQSGAERSGRPPPVSPPLPQ
jgi:hypothetical protein